MSTATAPAISGAGSEMGRIIRGLLRFQGLDDKDLAAGTGMSTRRLSNCLNGQTKYGFTPDEERRIAAYLGVKVGILSLTPDEAMERLLASGYRLTPLSVVQGEAGEQMELAFVDPPVLASA